MSTARQIDANLREANHVAREQLRKYNLDKAISDIEVRSWRNPAQAVEYFTFTAVADLTEAIVKDLRPIPDWRTMFRNADQADCGVLA